MIKINIDRVRICLTCPKSFFDNLFINFCLLDKNSIEFNGFHLSRIDSEENSRKKILASLFLEEDELLPMPTPAKLGNCEFRRSKNGIKCFFTFDTSSLYETDIYTYSIREKKVHKYNYFNYSFLAFEVMGLKFNNVTSIELAADTDSNVIHKINYAVGKPDLFEMILNNKTVKNPNDLLIGYSMFYQRSRKRISSKPTIYVKSSHHKDFGNNISLKVYDKAMEMAQKNSDKEPYIREWNDMKKNIYRIEVTIENKPFKRFFKKMQEQDPGKYTNVGFNTQDGRDFKKLLEKSQCKFVDVELHTEYGIEATKEAAKEDLEFFFMELGLNQDLRKEMFAYFSDLLLHFKLKNHTKDHISLLYLADNSIASFNKKRKQKAKEKKKAA